ncbi:MAG: hypothetical protein NTW62_00870 [Candidatus Nomurabacteria bacterium]|nr:hypothetical protein [Candidatus Nomurabacteria bacterium]
MRLLDSISVIFVVIFIYIYIFLYVTLPMFAGITMFIGMKDDNGLYISASFTITVINGFFIIPKIIREAYLRRILYFQGIVVLLSAYSFLKFFWQISHGLTSTIEQRDMMFSGLEMYCTLASSFMACLYLGSFNKALK